MDTEGVVVSELNAIDREGLMRKLADELPEISGELDLTLSEIAWRTGLNRERISMIVKGKRKMKWVEYLSILFFLWDDEKGRNIVERRGLFPETLKKVMTTNRNAH